MMKTLNLFHIANERINKIPRPEEDRSKLNFYLITGKSGRGWLVPLNSTSPGNSIYVTDSADWDKMGKGFGGSTLEFSLGDEEGKKFRLHGGWHSNADSLYSDTGIDLRNQYLTIIHIWTTSGNIIYEETDWVMGVFDRQFDILSELPEEYSKVYVSKRSMGGGFSGLVAKNENGEWK